MPLSHFHVTILSIENYIIFLNVLWYLEIYKVPPYIYSTKPFMQHNCFEQKLFLKIYVLK